MTERRTSVRKPTSTPSEPRTAKGRRTRTDLVAAARVVFERDGFFDARIADIAAEANAAHGTFYTYFPSKEDAFRAVIADFQDVIFDTGPAAVFVHSLSDRGANEVWDPVAEFAAIKESSEHFFRSYGEHARMIEVLEQVAMIIPEFADIRRSVRAQLVSRFEDRVRWLQSVGAADPELDAHVAAHALRSMADHFAYVWKVQKEPFDPAVAIDTISRIWLRAIGTDPAIPRDLGPGTRP